MKKNKRISPSKVGLVLGSVALLVAIIGYSALYLTGGVGKLAAPLIYTGFGIPFVFGMIGKTVAGCELKASGCISGITIGFIFGMAVVSIIYFVLGYLASTIIYKFNDLGVN